MSPRRVPTPPSGDDLPLSGVRPVEDDVRKELEFHLQERARELEARGLTPEQALAEARASFGDRRAVEDECREIESRRRNTRHRADRLAALQQDVRVGWRVLRKSPGFSLAAVVTLALGIGANSAVFSLVNHVLLQPLPYAHANRLMTVVERHERGWGNLPWSNFVDVAAQSHSFDAMAAFGAAPTTVLGGASPLRVTAGVVSAGFFNVFGIRPFMGRLTTASEHQLGAAPVAVVSYAFWRDNLGAPASLAGVRLRIDRDYAVVGVLPAGFDFPEGNQIWMPLEQQEQSLSRTAHNWEVVGKLKPRVSASTAQRELDGIFQRLARQYGSEVDAIGATVTSLQETLNGSYRTPLYLLFGASTLVLLAACVNLASAMLARGTARAGEFTVRFALGATRRRLVRQLVTESALLALAGCAAGLALAAALLKVLALFAPESLHVLQVQVDVPVQAFALVVAVLTTVLFGLLPAMRLSDATVSAALREGARGTSGARRMRVWNALVATEVALAVVLLSSSVLLIKSFTKVLQNRLGFDASHVQTVRVDLPESIYGDTAAAVGAFHERLLQRLQGRPGIDAIGFVNVLPLAGSSPNGSLLVEGKPQNPRGPYNASAIYRVAGGGYFAALGIPILKGRTFVTGGAREPAPAVVVSETFAREQWPDADPIGKRLRVAGMDRGEEPWYTVIGVVGDVRGNSPTSQFAATYYFDHRDRPAYRTRQASYAIRSSLSRAAVASLVRQEVAALDAQVPLTMDNMEDMVARSSAGRRFPMLVLGAFAAVALLMAIVGIYAVVSYAVAQRTREIGVRLALGATPVAVRALVLRSAVRTVVPGLIVGAALSIGAAGLLRSLLYGVSPFDPVAVVSALVLLGLAAVLSSAVPASRATRVDPLIAMRAN